MSSACSGSVAAPGKSSVGNDVAVLKIRKLPVVKPQKYGHGHIYIYIILQATDNIGDIAADGTQRKMPPYARSEETLDTICV